MGLAAASQFAQSLCPVLGPAVDHVFDIVERRKRVDLKMAAAAGLNDCQLLLLWEIACREQAHSQLELAERLGISTAQVSGVLQQLARRALIEGRRTPADRRRQVWCTTPAGRQLLDELLTRTDAAFRDWRPMAKELAEAVDGISGLDAGPRSSRPRPIADLRIHAAEGGEP